MYCNICKKEINHCEPHFNNGIHSYCLDCSLKQKYITNEFYVKNKYYFINLFNKEDYKHFKAIKKNDDIPKYKIVFDMEDSIYYVIDTRKPYMRDKRNSKEYIEWRNKVFERDSYTCQTCGQVGGDLNAHHIKPYKDYPKLRTVLKNGITLCYECHRRLHRK